MRWRAASYLFVPGLRLREAAGRLQPNLSLFV
jgi:hypothetical protein